MADELGFDEVVATLQNVIEFEFDLRDTITPETKILDYVLALLKQYPRIEKVINTFPIFRKQLSDLMVDESGAVVAALAGIPNVQNSYVFQMIVGADLQYVSTDHWVRFFAGRIIQNEPSA